jgi:hypothetical protein
LYLLVSIDFSESPGRMQRLNSRSARHQQPMIIAYYDEIMDQDVLRVVKKIRKRAGLPEMDNEPSKPSTSKKEIKHHSLLPKYNVEVQTDARSKEEKHLPITRRTGRKAKKEYREVIDFVDYEYKDEEIPLHPKMKMVPRKCVRGNEPGANRILNKNLERPKHKKPPKLDIALAMQVEDYDSPSKHIQRTEGKVTLGVPSHDDSYTLFPETPQEVFQQRPLYICAATNSGASFSFDIQGTKTAAETDDDDESFSMHTKSTQAARIYPVESMFDRFMDRIFGPLLEMDTNSLISELRPEDDDSLIAESFIGSYYRATSPTRRTQPALKHFQSIVQLQAPAERLKARPARRSRSLLEDVVDQILSRVSSSKIPHSPSSDSTTDSDEDTMAFMTEISFPISHYGTTTDDDDAFSVTNRNYANIATVGCIGC